MDIFSNPTVLLVGKYVGAALFFIVSGVLVYVFREFFKASWRELKHVVWPTRKETIHYFGLVVAMIVFFSIYLFIFTNIFSRFLLWLNNAI